MRIGLRWRLATYALPKQFVAPTVSGRYEVVTQAYRASRRTTKRMHARGSQSSLRGQ